jgi:hypothetical protein
MREIRAMSIDSSSSIDDAGNDATAPDKKQYGPGGEPYKKNPQFDALFKSAFQNIHAEIPIHPVFEDDGKWKEGFDNFVKDIDLAKTLGKDLNSTLTPAFESMFKAIESGQPALQAFFNSLLHSIEQVIAKLIAAAAEAAILSALSMGGSNPMGFGAMFSKVLGFSEGGIVPGSGNGDTVPAMLTPGELVVPKNMVASFVSAMKATGDTGALKGLQVPQFNMEGVRLPAFSMPSISAPVNAGTSDKISQSVKHDQNAAH